MRMADLDVQSMKYIGEGTKKIIEVIRSKLLLMTRRGVDLVAKGLHHGPQSYYAFASQLTRANVTMRVEQPLAGSRKHYSLKDGGKMQEKEMPTSELSRELAAMWKETERNLPS